MESLADRGDARVSVLASQVGWSARRIYRAVERRSSVLTVRDGAVSFAARTVRTAVQRTLATAPDTDDTVTVDIDAGDGGPLSA